ncbi:MAG: type II secretion system F family protein [Gaiellaceae bacterium]
MSTWGYSAINAQGIEHKGEIEASDASTAREQLRNRGLMASSLRQLGGAAAEDGSTASGRGKKIKPKSLQVFSRQFATMIEAGISVVGGLVVLEEQTEDNALRDVIEALRTDVEAGMLLSQAMSRHPKVFNRLYIAMVETGEAAGILDQVLDRVAYQIEKETKIKRRVKSAMLYPTIVLTFAAIVLSGMLMFLVPIFTKIFSSLNGELPTLTQYVVKASNLLRGYWFVIFPLVGAAIWGFRKWKSTEQGRQVWDAVKLKLPAKMGDTVLKITLARFSRTLATLVAAGVDIIRALEITASTAGNWVIEEALLDVREKVHEGIPISAPLSDNPVFPPMVGHMVKVGEETGELDKMLSKVADFYEDEVDTAIATLTSIIEPLMMICVGLVVGVIIISMYLPMFKMLSLVQ